jgi:hypothetical protein
MAMTTVVNVRETQDYDVYIGRGSDYGNPFNFGKDVIRSEVIEKFREYVLNEKKILSTLHNLRGKKLGCHCAPSPCHGDVLVDIIHTFFISFGYGHEHKYGKNTLDHNVLLKVKGINADVVLDWCSKTFENKYSNIYEYQPESNYFPRGVIESGVFVE